MGRSLTVLVAEDNVLGARTLQALLIADGHAPIVVHNGRHAIERLREGGIDLLITDIYMPDMDGIELLRRLRRQERLPPIIAISGGGRTVQVDYLDLARRLGASRVLRKPFTRRVLGAAIQEVMAAAEEEAADAPEPARRPRTSAPPKAAEFAPRPSEPRPSEPPLPQAAGGLSPPQDDHSSPTVRGAVAALGGASNDEPN